MKNSSNVLRAPFLSACLFSLNPSSSSSPSAATPAISSLLNLVQRPPALQRDDAVPSSPRVTAQSPEWPKHVETRAVHRTAPARSSRRARARSRRIALPRLTATRAPAFCLASETRVITMPHPLLPCHASAHTASKAVRGCRPTRHGIDVAEPDEHAARTLVD
ncbi:hypothetical protein B0J12DRAFT_773095 [Macrophomina phaseolina]|uniref:Uncharacterized protein n=1 Tax=Macrophomina phaseolina TaxID=35725 RepID=A0ABQ8GLK2_9PEZI|nr:hypothetical protein B0J12DRAFT_773095 [Macrophomina phaseolina]